jgi:TRAP-type C4-dicarboxylate transport system permease small subunit
METKRTHSSVRPFCFIIKAYLLFVAFALVVLLTGHFEATFLVTFLPPFGRYFNAACAAARRAIGTRNGEQET